MSSLSSFGIISVVVSYPKICLCISASAADAAAVNSNGSKTLLANRLSTFFSNANFVFNNGPRILSRNLTVCVILDNYVFDIDSLILTDKLFAKDLRRFSTYLLVNNNLCGKLVSELPIIFDETTSISFFIADSNFSTLTCNHSLTYLRLTSVFM